jgi:hypothetical protein
MCAVARRLTRPDSRPRVRNDARDTGVIVCRLALGPAFPIQPPLALVRRRPALGCCSTPPPSASHYPAWCLCWTVRRMPAFALEERKLPIRAESACQPNCRGWVSAVGIVTADSPRDFDEFARPTTRRRDDCAGFQRRFGQRFDRARTALTPRGADYRRHQRPDQYRAGRFCQYCSLGVLRIDVRVPASYLARRIT